MIIIISKSRCVNITSGEVWSSGMKVMGLFGVITPTLHATMFALHVPFSPNLRTICEILYLI